MSISTTKKSGSYSFHINFAIDSPCFENKRLDLSFQITHTIESQITFKANLSHPFLNS